MMTAIVGGNGSRNSGGCGSGGSGNNKDGGMTTLSSRFVLVYES